MEKYFLKPKYKRFNLKRSKKGILKKRRWNKEKKIRNVQRNLSLVDKTKEEFYDKFRDFKKVKAPRDLSFRSNPDGVIDFIKKLKDYFIQKRKVFVILKDVIKIDYDGIVVLLSIMVRFKSQKIEFNGDFPINEDCRKILISSKFLPNLNKYLVDNDRYKLGELNTIHTHAWKNVDSKLGEKIIEKASEKIWGSKKRCQGVQRTLIELMQNTNNHATIGVPGDKHWWLSVTYDLSNNKVCFSFVDYGVGVFESLKNKQSGSKFFDWYSKMFSKYSFKSNSELMKLILDGDLHRTVTGQHYRGKGLPGIKEAFSRNQISNLYVITNNVFADVANDSYRTLTNSFEGTFIYWELKQDNINCHGAN